jgi:hypothetical protein
MNMQEAKERAMKKLDQLERSKDNEEKYWLYRNHLYAILEEDH